MSAPRTERRWQRHDCMTGRITGAWPPRTRLPWTWLRVTVSRPGVDQMCNPSSVHSIRKVPLLSGSSSVQCPFSVSQMYNLKFVCPTPEYSGFCFVFPGSGVCEIKYHLQIDGLRFPAPSPQEVKVDLQIWETHLRGDGTLFHSALHLAETHFQL